MYKSNFVEKVKSSLISLNIDLEKVKKNKVSFGLGISGGADSVSLFLSLCEILSPLKIPLVCVTVNHHIRPKCESDADMNFVINLYEKFKKDFDLRLEVFDIPEGKVMSLSKNEKCGIEDAARKIRYSCFDEAIEKHNIAYFCLAHNLNDNLETILMRFLQGSRSGGIQSSRGVFIRPLINIERCDIEDFLKFKNQSYCIDSTNSCDNYLRNNIRLNLVPVLNEKFPGWKTAVLKGEEKRKLDNDCLESIAAKKDFSEDLFDSENEALLDRVLIKFFNQNGITGRIPKVFLKDFSSQLHNAVNKKKDFLQRYGEFETGYKNGNLFIKRLSKRQTDFCFFAIIEKEGEFQFPFGVVHVFKSESGAVVLSHSGKSVTYNVDFPFVIRSPVTGEKKQLYVVEG